MVVGTSTDLLFPLAPAWGWSQFLQSFSRLSINATNSVVGSPTLNSPGQFDHKPNSGCLPKFGLTRRPNLRLAPPKRAPPLEALQSKVPPPHPRVSAGVGGCCWRCPGTSIISSAGRSGGAALLLVLREGHEAADHGQLAFQAPAATAGLPPGLLTFIGLCPSHAAVASSLDLFTGRAQRAAQERLRAGRLRSARAARGEFVAGKRLGGVFRDVLLLATS